MSGSEVDKVARSYLDSVDGGKYKGKFIHSLGHSVGIEVHDGEGFSPGSKLKLKENMVITAEPGVYVTGFWRGKVRRRYTYNEEGAQDYLKGEFC